MRLRKFVGVAVTLAGLETVVVTLALSQGIQSTAEAALVTGGFLTMLVGYCIWGWHKPD